MTHHIDDFSKSLANESVPRRDTFRLLGAALAGAVLSPFGLRTAWAGRPSDPCKTFCKCRDKQQQDACLAACHSCNGDPGRLCGSCGSYACCAAPGPYQNGACIDGRCSYWCVQGAADCGNGCTPLWFDPNNCGACGNVCPQSAPVCYQGVCGQNPCSPPTPTYCNGVCVNTLTDMNNCGGCGGICQGDYCAAGQCLGIGNGNGD